MYETVSIMRGDGVMHVTPYLRYFIGRTRPHSSSAQTRQHKMFTRYAWHVEDIWIVAKDWPHDGCATGWHDAGRPADRN